MKKYELNDSLYFVPARLVFPNWKSTSRVFKAHQVEVGDGKQFTAQKRFVLRHSGRTPLEQNVTIIPPTTNRFELYCQLVKGENSTRVVVPTVVSLGPNCHLACHIIFVPPRRGSGDYLWDNFQDRVSVTVLSRGELEGREAPRENVHETVTSLQLYSLAGNLDDESKDYSWCDLVDWYPDNQHINDVVQRTYAQGVAGHVKSKQAVCSDEEDSVSNAVEEHNSNSDIEMPSPAKEETPSLDSNWLVLLDQGDNCTQPSTPKCQPPVIHTLHDPVAAEKVIRAMRLKLGQPPNSQRSSSARQQKNTISLEVFDEMVDDANVWVEKQHNAGTMTAELENRDIRLGNQREGEQLQEEDDYYEQLVNRIRNAKTARDLESVGILRTGSKAA